MDIPAAAYYGIHTARAVSNFPISGDRLAEYPAFIAALAAVKEAAARANGAVGRLTAHKAEAISAAAAAIRGGELRDQFVVDMIQGGAGTSTNMNVNEVIANRSLELLGFAKGDYARIHPVDDVNSAQSTNDVYPTAARIALDTYVGDLLVALAGLQQSLARKAAEFHSVIKMGRTQLQDAVPMTLGQEFNAFARAVGQDMVLLANTRLDLHRVNLGGTAIGTQLNAGPRYRERALEGLRQISRIPTLESAEDLIEATSDVGAFVELSGVLKRTALKISKMCSDLRLLSSGPQGGLGEINLPPRQAGSSIMPGKINPVIPEVVNQVAFEVVGNDVTVSLAAENGQLQLNAFEPIIVYMLFRSLRHLTAASNVLASECVGGVTANADALRDRVYRSGSVTTALSARLGYQLASEIAHEALATGRSALQIVGERRLMTDGELTRLLRSSPGFESILDAAASGYNGDMRRRLPDGAQ